MKIKTTFAVLGAILALSACTVEMTSTPTTSPVEATDAPDTTVTVKPLVLPTAVPTTVEVVSVDELNDGTLSAFEWAVVVDVLADEYGIELTTSEWDGIEEMGVNLCSIAHDSATQEDFVIALDVIAAGSGMAPDKVGFISGVVMASMCVDELTALGIG